MKSIHLLGVRVDDVTLSEALDKTDELMREPRLHHVVTINPEFIIAARRNPDFARVLAESDLCLPDGANLIRASQRQGTPLRERVAGTDYIWYLSGLAAVCGWKVFLLGGRGGVGGLAGARLQARYRKLKLVGTFEGSPDPIDEPEILARIRDSEPDILYVAYGAPAQDLWIHRNRERLAGVRLAVGVGGAFDFIARRVPRAPDWMQNAGLEWLFRLLVQPWRVRRQVALVTFTLLMLRQPRNRPPEQPTANLADEPDA